MDIKHLVDHKSDKNLTPKSEVGIFGKRISHGVNTDSPFKNLPNFSTPPSRFAKIINPFEPHLIERLHLPTFSPNVFVQNSTPKTEQKFKWTIEDISCLKPADIDEATVSQHISTDDPHIESVVQQKIDTFFQEKEIVPSPMHIKSTNVPLIKDCTNIENTPPKVFRNRTSDGSTQTMLTLPPVLPADLELALKPYFIFNEQKEIEEDHLSDNSLYRQLFVFEEKEDESVHTDVQSLLSSPALSTGFSPISFSPDKGFGSPFDMPELRDCNLSPISKNSPKVRLSRSACRLNFSENMSVDASLVVPDIENQCMSNSVFSTVSDASAQGINDPPLEATLNWSMEYKQVSLGSPPSTNSDRMDISNSDTPHSKMFSGQRKRLSESFKLEESDDPIFRYGKDGVQNRNKIFRNELTDMGYCTQEMGDCSDLNVFASTPTKRNNEIV